LTTELNYCRLFATYELFEIDDDDDDDDEATTRVKQWRLLYCTQFTTCNKFCPAKYGSLCDNGSGVVTLDDFSQTLVNKR